jgi:hypothetical protein
VDSEFKLARGLGAGQGQVPAAASAGTRSKSAGPILGLGIRVAAPRRPVRRRDRVVLASAVCGRGRGMAVVTWADRPASPSHLGWSSTETCTGCGARDAAPQPQPQRIMRGIGARALAGASEAGASAWATGLGRLRVALGAGPGADAGG